MLQRLDFPQIFKVWPEDLALWYYVPFHVLLFILVRMLLLFYCLLIYGSPLKLITFAHSVGDFHVNNKIMKHVACNTQCNGKKDLKETYFHRHVVHRMRCVHRSSQG